MENKRIYLAAPHMSGKEIGFIEEAFKANWVSPLGPHVDKFEASIASYVGVKEAAALSSGTAAIHLALKALNIKENDVVFCSDLTFIGSCNPVFYENAEQVFIDSERESWNMCPKALEKAFLHHKKLGKLPKAVIVVQLYGQSADMDKIIKLCNEYNVPILEDSAESLGATYKGRQTGSLGELGVFSFNGNKIITTSGGGILVSNNEEYIKKARFWSTQSKNKSIYYDHTEIGYNYRMSNIVASIGLGQILVLDERIAYKKVIYETYKEGFKDNLDIEMMPICDYGSPNYWLSVIRINKECKVKPIDIIEALEKYNIEARPIWKPMHMQPIFKNNKYYTNSDEGSTGKGSKVNSISEDIFTRGVCLPSDTQMNKNDLQKVISIIKALLRKS